MSEVPYEIVKATKKISINKPEDRLWIKAVNSQKFDTYIKLTCSCMKNLGIEVILKPYSYTNKKNRTIYYIGQCNRCEKIYWSL